jgi:hypothetical protein
MEFCPDGRIRIEFPDGTVTTLRRPLYGEFKKARLALSETRDDISRVSAAFAEQTVARLAKDAAPEDATGDETVEPEEPSAAEIIATAEEMALVPIMGWWRRLCGPKPDGCGLADRPLPDDPDDWPSEMLIETGILPRVIEHWRSNPLDRGQMGQPVPQQR